MKTPAIQVTNEPFLSIAQQADARKELNDFGKAVTVIIVYLAREMERGASEAEIDILIACIKPGVIETAAQLVRETAPHARD